MSSSSPQRSMGGNSNSGGGGEDQRPRFFDKMVKKMCWENAEIVPGRHPERWRKDAAGNIVCKRFCNCHGCLCYEYDHILPFSKGLLCFPISLFSLINFLIFIFSYWDLWAVFAFCANIEIKIA